MRICAIANQFVHRFIAVFEDFRMQILFAYAILIAEDMESKNLHDTGLSWEETFMDDNREKETLFKKHRENIYFRWGFTAFVVIVACIIVAQFVTKFTSFFGIVGSLIQTLAPVFYGLGIAYLLDPIVGRIAKLLLGHNSPNQ